MDVTTVRANVCASRCSAFWSWPKNAFGSFVVVPVVTSYSSRTCIDGFDQSTLSSFMSLNSMLAVMMNAYFDAWLLVVNEVGADVEPLMAQVSTASTPVVSGTVL